MIDLTREAELYDEENAEQAYYDLRSDEECAAGSPDRRCGGCGRLICDDCLQREAWVSAGEDAADRLAERSPYWRDLSYEKPGMP